MPILAPPSSYEWSVSHPDRADRAADARFPGLPPDARPPRPIIGFCLAVYGVLLWSFVVAGQFATSWITVRPAGQGTAAFLVIVATGAAWGFALQRSRNALPSATMGRFIWRGHRHRRARLPPLPGHPDRRDHLRSVDARSRLPGFFLVAVSLAAMVMGAPDAAEAPGAHAPHEIRDHLDVGRGRHPDVRWGAELATNGWV